MIRNDVYLLGQFYHQRPCRPAVEPRDVLTEDGPEKLTAHAPHLAFCRQQPARHVGCRGYEHARGEDAELDDAWPDDRLDIDDVTRVARQRRSAAVIIRAICRVVGKITATVAMVL